MQTLAELEAKQAKERAKLEKEHAFLTLLPKTERAPSMLMADALYGATLVKYSGPTYPKNPITLVEALAIVHAYAPAFTITECEHWRSGCLSTVPEALTPKNYKERGQLVGAHVVEITCEGGEGYGPTSTLTFWALHESGAWAEVKIEVDLGWHPRRVPVYGGRNGREIVGHKFELMPFGDDRRKWSAGGSGPHEKSYRLSHYWVSVEQFEAWAEDQVREGGASC